MLAADIYAKGLTHLGHGYPLWIPEPSDGKEVLIGDVGYLLGGRFYRLFNVTKPRDHPLNSGGVPSRFEILDLERQPLHSVPELFPPKASICSHNVSATDITAGAAVSTGLTQGVGAGVSYRFNCNTEEGALLLLKDHASSQEIHPSSKLFINYMRAHYLDWCRFASETYQLALAPEEIVFVRGWVKTTEWALAAFQQGGSGQELSLQAEGTSLAKAKFSISASQHHSTSVLQRAGPRRTEDAVHNPSPPQDQCIFLSYFKLKRSLFGIKIVAAAEPRDLGGRGSSPEPTGSILWNEQPINRSHSSPGPDYGVQAYPEHAPPWDPLDDILDYILEASGMDVAITSHFALRQLQWPQDNDIISSLRRLQPPITVLDSQVGILEAEQLQYNLPSYMGNISLSDSISVLSHPLQEGDYWHPPLPSHSDLVVPGKFDVPPSETPRETWSSELKREPEAETGIPSKSVEYSKNAPCRSCKARRVKCEFETDPDTCERCLMLGDECVITSRRKGRAPPTREDLMSNSSLRQRSHGPVTESCGTHSDAEGAASDATPPSGAVGHIEKTSTAVAMPLGGDTTQDVTQGERQSVDASVISETTVDRPESVMDYEVEALLYEAGWEDRGRGGGKAPSQPKTVALDRRKSDPQDVKAKTSSIQGKAPPPRA